MNKLKSLVFIFSIFSIIPASLYARKNKGDFYQLKIYYLKNDDQVARVDEYLKNAYLPAMHRSGIKNIGVFKPLTNDTSLGKFIYVLIPFNSVEAWMRAEKHLSKDEAYSSLSKSFTEAPFDKAPYERIESILLDAFPGQEHLKLPPGKNPGRVFELRSYESPTENLHNKKMAMFNTGGEIEIFNRLAFNPVFYGKVLSGNHMPNFMYMPIFESLEQRNDQWKRFGDDSVWKRISADPINENKVSVSHIDSILMHSTSYSDY